MKFIVKVRLVEKSAKRRVGRVMVEKVMIQMSNPDIPLAMVTRICPRSASHEVEWEIMRGKGVADCLAVLILAPLDTVSRREVGLWEAVLRLP